MKYLLMSLLFSQISWALSVDELVASLQDARVKTLLNDQWIDLIEDRGPRVRMQGSFSFALQSGRNDFYLVEGMNYYRSGGKGIKVIKVEDLGIR